MRIFSILLTIQLFLSFPLFAQQTVEKIKTINTIGECLSRLSIAKEEGYPFGRANLWISARQTLSLSLYYNTIDDTIPMEYNVTVRGGFGGEQVKVDAVDFIFAFKEEITKEEISESLKAAKEDPGYMKFFFPHGIVEDLDSPKGREQVETLLMFYPVNIKKREKPLRQLLGVRGYSMIPITDEQYDAIMSKFYEQSITIPLKDNDPLEIILQRKDGTGQSVDISRCMRLLD